MQVDETLTLPDGLVGTVLPPVYRFESPHGLMYFVQADGDEQHRVYDVTYYLVIEDIEDDEDEHPVRQTFNTLEEVAAFIAEQDAEQYGDEDDDGA